MPSRIDPNPKSPILILGGTDTVGSRIANQLATAAIPALVASSSGTAPESEHLTRVKFDWFDDTTYDAPFEAAGEAGIRAVYVIAPPVVNSGPTMIKFIDHALAKGTRRFVLQSATPIEAGASDWSMGQVHLYLRELGNQGRADWCALRPTLFQEIFSEQKSHIDSIKQQGKIYSATGIGKIPWVSADDVAEVAIKVLTQEEPPHTEYKLLGPYNMTYNDVAEMLSEILGRRIKHVELPQREIEESLQKDGLPADYSRAVGGHHRRISLHREHIMNDVVATILGRKPKMFRVTAEEAKAVWQ